MLYYFSQNLSKSGSNNFHLALAIDFVTKNEQHVTVPGKAVTIHN